MLLTQWAKQRHSHLQKPVEWDPEKENVREQFHKGEESVRDPVSQPLGVIVFLVGLYGLDSKQTETDGEKLTEFATII